MRISYQRTGGFAGMVLNFDIQTESLSPEEGQSLLELVDAAGFFDLPSKIVSGEMGVDRFHYKLSISTEEQQHTVEVGDASAPDNLWPLLEKLRLLSRTINRDN
jgi:hypothetical protein